MEKHLCCIVLRPWKSKRTRVVLKKMLTDYMNVVNLVHGLFCGISLNNADIQYFLCTAHPDLATLLRCKKTSYYSDIIFSRTRLPCSLFISTWSWDPVSMKPVYEWSQRWSSHKSFTVSISLFELKQNTWPIKNYYVHTGSYGQGKLDLYSSI